MISVLTLPGICLPVWRPAATLLDCINLLDLYERSDISRDSVIKSVFGLHTYCLFAVMTIQEEIKNSLLNDPVVWVTAIGSSHSRYNGTAWLDSTHSLTLLGTNVLRFLPQIVHPQYRQVASLTLITHCPILKLP